MFDGYKSEGSFLQQEGEGADEVLGDAAVPLVVPVLQRQPVRSLHHVQVHFSVRVPVEGRQSQTPLRYLPHLHQLPEVLDTPGHLALRHDPHLLLVLDGLGPRLELEHFEDVSWQEDAQLLPLVGLVLEGEDEGAEGVVVDQQGDGNLDLVPRGYLSELEGLPEDFVVVGVEQFAFDPGEAPFPIVGQVQQHAELVGPLELGDHPDFESVGLMQQLLLPEAGPLEPDLELLAQDLEVRQSLHPLALVVQHLQLPRHQHRGLQLSRSRQRVEVGAGFLAGHSQLLLQLLVLVPEGLAYLGTGFMAVSELEQFYALFVEVGVELLQFRTLLGDLFPEPVEFTLFLVSEVAAETVQFLPLALELLLEQSVLVPQDLQLLVAAPVLLLVQLRGVGLVMLVLLLKVDLPLPQHLDLLPVGNVLRPQPLHRPALLLLLLLQGLVLLLRTRQLETVLLDLGVDALRLATPRSPGLEVSPDPLLGQQFFAGELHVVLLLDCVEVLLEEVDFLAEGVGLAVVGGGVGGEGDARSGLELGAGVVVADLDALRLEHCLGLVLEAEHPFAPEEAGLGVVAELLAVGVVELLVDHGLATETVVVGQQLGQFVGAGADLTAGQGRSLDLVEVGEVFGDGVLVENLRARQGVLEFVLVGELLGGEQLFFEGEEEVVGLGDDLVGEVVVAGVAEAGVGGEGGLALEELDPFCGVVHGAVTLQYYLTSLYQ